MWMKSKKDFKCSNESRYILNNQICDGIVDCESASDELLCNYKSLIINDSFCTSKTVYNIECHTQNEVFECNINF